MSPPRSKSADRLWPGQETDSQSWDASEKGISTCKFVLPTQGISTATFRVTVWALLYILSCPLSFRSLFSFLFLDVPPHSFLHIYNHFRIYTPLYFDISLTIERLLCPQYVLYPHSDGRLRYRLLLHSNRDGDPNPLGLRDREAHRAGTSTGCSGHNGQRHVGGGPI